MTPERMEAGRDYLVSLNALGLYPEGLLWAYHEERDEMVLAIVSSIVDRVGPKEIYEVLFEAYEKAGTPASIDPWIVSVFSPKSIFTDDFRAMMAMDVHAQAAGGAEIASVLLSVTDGYVFEKEWVYIAQTRNDQSKHQVAEWKRFRQNVHHLAA